MMTLPYLNLWTAKPDSIQITTSNEALGQWRSIASISRSGYFMISDDVTDVSNTELFITCLLRVDDKFEVHEDFIGLH